MKDRIRRIMESKQMSQQEFAQKLELSPASLSSIFTGRTNPTNKHAQAIHKAFPEVSINWLMFGEGDMYSSASAAIDLSTSYDANPSVNNAYDGSSVEASYRNEASGISQPTIFDIPMSSSHDISSAYRSNENSKNLSKVKNHDIVRRAVKEIRVFYDDGTYESFAPSKEK